MKRISDIVILLTQCLLGYLLVTFAGDWTSEVILVVIASAFILCGFAIGITALWNLRKSFAVAPQPRDNVELIQSGIYKYIRHPMYSAIFFVTTGILVARFTPEAIVVAIVIVIFFAVKIHFEEKALRKKYGGYEMYMTKTGRIFPRIQSRGKK